MNTPVRNTTPRNLNLIKGGKDRKKDPACADGFVCTQRFQIRDRQWSKIWTTVAPKDLTLGAYKKFCRTLEARVGTSRFPEPDIGYSLILASSGAYIELHTQFEANLSKHQMRLVSKAFSAALRFAGIMQNPMNCKLAAVKR